MGYRAVADAKAPGRQILGSIDLQSVGDLYVYGHWRVQPAAAKRLADHGFRIIVLIRDPRDICLSMADYLCTGRHPSALKAEPSISNMSLRQLQIATIKGFDLPNYKSSPIGKVCDGWKKWQDHGAIVVRYEDIERSVRSGILMQELRAIGVDPQTFLTAALQRIKLRGAAPGECRWQREFDDELRDIWTNHAQGVAASLGYREL
jgi:hypothetical protein